MSGSSTRLTRKLPPWLSFTSFLLCSCLQGAAEISAAYLPVSAPLFVFVYFGGWGGSKEDGPSGIESRRYRQQREGRCSALALHAAPHTPIGTTTQVRQQLYQQIADAKFSLQWHWRFYPLVAPVSTLHRLTAELLSVKRCFAYVSGESLLSSAAIIQPINVQSRV
jgi:hypothetical protein